MLLFSFMQNFINLQRDLMDGGGSTLTIADIPNTFVDSIGKEFTYISVKEKVKNPERELTLEEWMEKFKVSSKYVPDTTVEEEIKQLKEKFNADVKKAKLQSLKKYCRVNQDFQRL